MRCAKCGSDNPEGKKFCGDCGAMLSADVRTTPLTAALENAGAASAISVSSEPGSGKLPEGERKMVTALFADIKGSTELMEDLDPEEARAIVDPALTRMIEAVHRYDGYIVQSTGDGIFALFGAPAAHEDHPQRALYAAIRMQDELRRYSATLVADGGMPIEARIGANTGEVVVRSIATGGGHAEYTPIGHTTNLASRMQAVAPTGSIAVSEATRRLVEGFFQLRPIGPTKVKGVSEPVNVYEVTGLGPLRTRLQRAVGRGLTKFVGRERELEALRHAAELATQGHGQIAAAVADPGVGKSRLFYEFKARSQSGWMVLEALSVSHGKASAYLPVIDLLRAYFKIADADDERTRREKIAGRIAILDRTLEDTLPYLFALFSLVEGDDPLAAMDAQVRRRRTLDAIKRMLLRESLKQPLMLMFEDLHWIDEGTQALLSLLGDSIGTAKVLLLVNYRPEYRHEWDSKTYYTQLRLDPLGRETADEMLSSMLGNGRELIPLKRLIVDRTEGNPFFMEEIVQALFDQGALVRNGAIRLTAPLDQLRIPPTVQAILAARIDRLPPGLKQLLQTLAVIGREFSLPLLRGVTQLADDELERMLAGLQMGEFIYEQPAIPDVEYSFKHALTQEVAYNSLLTERRRLVHGQTAAAIEAVYSGHLEDHLGELAHHYSRSGNAAKAVEYLRRAGEQAARRSVFQEAVNQLNAALGLLEKLAPGPSRDSQELALRMALTGPLFFTRGFTTEEAKLNVDRALALSRGIGDAVTTVRALSNLFPIYFVGGNLRTARELAGQMLEIAARNPDDITTYLANETSGMSAAWMGELRSAQEHLERALAISEAAVAASGGPGRSIVIPVLSWVLWMRGYPDQTLRAEARLRDMLSHPVDLFDRAGMTSNILLTRCHLMRDFRGIRGQAQGLLAVARENGFPLFVGMGLLWLGRILVEEGNFAEGSQMMVEATLTYKDLIGMSPGYQYFCCVSADAYLAAGRPAEGLAALEEAIDQAKRDENHFCEPDLHRLKGDLLLLAGAPESEAEKSLREAIAIAQRQEAKSWELRATTSLARLLKRQGKINEARLILSEIYNWFTEGFDTADLKEAKALLDELSRTEK